MKQPTQPAPRVWPRPHFIESVLLEGFDGPDKTYLVCSNCAFILPVDSKQEHIDLHYSKCSPILGPFTWDIDPEVPELDEYSELPCTEYTLRCNGIVVLNSEDPDMFPEVDRLNQYQASPFEVATGEYQYKYEFHELLTEHVASARVAIIEALDETKYLEELFARSGPYLDDPTRAAYRLVTQTLAKGLHKAFSAVNTGA